ncbi:MAG TPA: CehA/McbA family metallohydrolase [Dyella sp.]|uniref:CehA/McbA family metallohydrolase n=1 Tax=Dyella sp. TaxID=1869338 RepID=UPI002F9549F6
MKNRIAYRLAIAALAICALLLGIVFPAFANDAPDRVLHGTLDGKDNHTYRTLPFDVPAGTTRITVQFEYTGHDEEHTTIDLGLLGPDGLRGWSGGSKHVFTVAATDATPSYLPGPIHPGLWKVLLGVPNIRATSHSTYQAKIWFGHADDPAWLPAVLHPPLRNEPGWYRGDLHMHTTHSDGSCKSQSGQKVPCPLFFTVQGAAERDLDFIAITDHNTVSHANAMLELQPYFDRLLLIPGREVTTFSGHANLFGTTAPVDFRVGSKDVPDWNALLHAIAPLGGLISINHAIRPSGEPCMGCGWTADPPADMHLIQAIEIVNGGDAGTPYSAVPFWEQQLAKGIRLTGIGGSDNHNAFQDAPGIGSNPTGIPTTVVHAQALSMPAILDGVRAGEVFIDVQGSRDRLLEFTGRVDAQVAAMGGTLQAPSGRTIDFDVHVAHAADTGMQVFVDGKHRPEYDVTIADADQRRSFRWAADGQPHWLRIEVHDVAGKPLLIGNPIYVNFAQAHN